ncbi:hypothetical protein GGP51_003221 [Salinibacter ruber]|uniref:hypothetical protein n=1 Tax=Salinibacter ruber TaxID=146919 RepID=UPI00216A2840|nr:hypothetical protein [Salinibacter ruber]MCS4191724.1 hypothetical protein [Salinibacter ruber]
MAVSLDQIVAAVAQNRERICRLEDSLEAISRGENVTQEDLDEASQRALEEIKEQFPEADFNL